MLTACSSAVLTFSLLIPQIRHSQITGDLDAFIWVVITFMSLLFLQCLTTIFSKRFSPEKKVYRSLILTFVFAIPWFLIYQ